MSTPLVSDHTFLSANLVLHPLEETANDAPGCNVTSYYSYHERSQENMRQKSIYLLLYVARGVWDNCVEHSLKILVLYCKQKY